MSIGHLNRHQKQVVERNVEGQVVVDLGAGDGNLSLELVELGARRVIAVDKNPMPRYLSEAGAETVCLPFKRLVFLPADVAFLSWPDNHEQKGLLEILERIPVVVYLGKNTDGAACAWPLFFARMLEREVLDYVPAPENTLIVWGPRRVVQRQPLGEELAGLKAYKDLEPRSYASVEQDG